MRLDILSVEAMRPLQRLKLRLFKRFIGGGKIPPVFFPVTYRRELFGRQFIALLQESLRRESDWSVGELELFAAYVSSLNRCRY